MKDLSISYLLDVYGELLNEKQKRIAVDYFNEDLSLSEISDNEGVTRQAAHETIKKVEQLLHFYESKLHYRQLTSLLKEAAQKGDTDEIYRLIEEM